MLIGLAESTGRHIALGLVMTVAEAAQMVKYREPPLAERAASLLGSGLVLDEAFTERRLLPGEGPPRQGDS